MEESARQAWTRENKKLRLDMEGVDIPLFITPKLFKSGSVGWYLSEKVTMSDTRFQVSVSVTMIKSKREAEPEEVNGQSPYKDGFDVAPLLDSALEAEQKASGGPQKRQKRS